jgi:hypothetical protein
MLFRCRTVRCRRSSRKSGASTTIPELKAQTFAWKERRDEFMKKFNANDAQTLKQAWQRFYFVGKMPDGSQPVQHLHKLRLAAPVDRRKGPA